MDKETVVHIYSEILLTHKKEWKSAVTGMDLDYHTKWTKSERQIPYAVTYMWNLKCDTNDLWNRNRFPNTENRLLTAKEEGALIYI